MDNVQKLILALLSSAVVGLLTLGWYAGRFEARLDAVEGRQDRQSAYILHLEAYVQTLDGSKP